MSASRSRSLRERAGHLGSLNATIHDFIMLNALADTPANTRGNSASPSAPSKERSGDGVGPLADHDRGHTTTLRAAGAATLGNRRRPHERRSS